MLDIISGVIGVGVGNVSDGKKAVNKAESQKSSGPLCEQERVLEMKMNVGCEGHLSGKEGKVLCSCQPMALCAYRQVAPWPWHHTSWDLKNGGEESEELR